MPQQNDMTQVLIERVGDGAPEDQSRAIAGVHESSQESSSALDVSSVAAMSSIVHSDAGQNESDVESEEFAKLRCSSVQTEVISARRRRNPSAGYPGLAFGSSLFSSGTIMKFRVISNELHNIQNVQLKRVSDQSFQCYFHECVSNSSLLREMNTKNNVKIFLLFIQILLLFLIS